MSTRKLYEGVYERMWREAKPVPCEYCGVPVGELCIKANGETAAGPHMRRLELARQQTAWTPAGGPSYSWQVDKDDC